MDLFTFVIYFKLLRNNVLFRNLGMPPMWILNIVVILAMHSINLNVFQTFSDKGVSFDKNIGKSVTN